MSVKVAVLGATGPTGLLVVDQALSRGHQVVAIIRTPERLGELASHPGVTVKVVADVSRSDSEAQLAEAFTGCQAVVSALGATTSMFRIDLLTQTVPIVTAAMRSAGVTRLVLVTAQCTVYHPDHPKLVEWIVKPLMIGRNLDDFWRAECHLTEKCGDLNYTVVKPPRLTNLAMRDAGELKACEGQYVPGATESVPRANVAKFVLDCAESQSAWSRKLVAIQF